MCAEKVELLSANRISTFALKRKENNKGISGGSLPLVTKLRGRGKGGSAEYKKGAWLRETKNVRKVKDSLTRKKIRRAFTVTGLWGGQGVHQKKTRRRRKEGFNACVK